MILWLVGVPMLDCKIIGPGRAVRQTTAVNELAIVAGPPFRIIQVQVRIGTEQLAVCSGDGLIVADPYRLDGI